MPARYTGRRMKRSKLSQGRSRRMFGSALLKRRVSGKKRRSVVKRPKGTRYSHVTDYFLMPLTIPRPPGASGDIEERTNYHEEPFGNGHLRNIGDMRESTPASGKDTASVVVFRCGLHEQTFNNLGVQGAIDAKDGYCIDSNGFPVPTKETATACEEDDETNSWIGKTTGTPQRKVGYNIGFNKIPDKWGVPGHPAPGNSHDSHDTAPTQWYKTNVENMLWENQTSVVDSTKPQPPEPLVGYQIVAQIKSFPNTADIFAPKSTYYIPNSVLKFIDIDMKFASAGCPFNTRLTLKVVRRIGPEPMKTFDWDIDENKGGDDDVTQHLLLNHGSRTNTQQYQTLYRKSINIAAAKPGLASNNKIHSIKKKLHVNLPRSQIRSVNESASVVQFGQRTKNSLSAAEDGFYNSCFIVITCKNLDDQYVANVSVPIGATGTYEHISVLKNIVQQDPIYSTGAICAGVGQDPQGQTSCESHKNTDALGNKGYKSGNWLRLKTKDACNWAQDHNAQNARIHAGGAILDTDLAIDEDGNPSMWMDPVVSSWQTTAAAKLVCAKMGYCTNANWSQDPSTPNAIGIDPSLDFNQVIQRNEKGCLGVNGEWVACEWNEENDQCEWKTNATWGKDMKGPVAPYCLLTNWCSEQCTVTAEQNPYSTPSFAQFKYGGRISMGSQAKTTNDGTQDNVVTAGGVSGSDAAMTELQAQTTDLAARLHALLEGAGATDHVVDGHDHAHDIHETVTGAVIAGDHTHGDGDAVADDDAMFD